jgi:uncharacterized protein (UPF0264 family)
VPTPEVPTRLLVSVRSAAEAADALAGGADLIDVKEPARGPLGRAEDAVLGAVLALVAGRRPVSAALGELTDDAFPPAAAGLGYVKWGLAGWSGRPGWRDALRRLLLAAGPGLPRVVVAAYADWPRAGSPPVPEVCALARQHPGSTLLVDTFDKGPPRRTLRDWMPVPALVRLCARCREAGVRVALAGSLGPDEIAEVLPARPDWVAVRGAACRGGRTGTVRADRVRLLVNLLRGFQ